MRYNTSPRSQSTKLVIARRRSDLIAVETRHKHDSAVVVKDPVSLRYYRLRPDEYFVLQMLDGTVSLEQIRQRYEQRFAPSRVTLPELNRLLFRFHRNGLTIADAPTQGDRLIERRRTERRQRWRGQLASLLFIRFPGVDPEPLLRRIYPLVRPWFGWWGKVLAVLVCFTAAWIFLMRWEQFYAEFPKMNQWLRLESVLVLAAAIGVSKVFHELGHALVCKHFGGECHSIGPMLLVFTPALYCDTSDSWMLPNRWQRAAVGMAGIGAEILLAAIATIVWSMTASGMTHYIAMNLMLVCSVSTLLFNANPLLRYDGYYVLSDLWDIPNLGERSRKLLAYYVKRGVLGVRELEVDEVTGANRFWMLVYAISSTVYRWVILLMILWIISLMLRPYRLESLGYLLCFFAVGGMAAAAFQQPLAFFRNPARRRSIRMSRLFWSASLLILLIAASFWPLPAHVSADARIVPRVDKPIVVTTGGRLATLHAAPGSLVSEGDRIATLVNPDVELQYLAAKGRFETQQLLVESIRSSQVIQPETGNQLPAAELMLEDFRQQMKRRREQLEALVLTASATGKLVVGPLRREPGISEDALDYELVSWSGYPTESKNAECYLEPGTELMSVVKEDLWDAEVTLSQGDVARIKIGGDVRLILESLPAQTIEGTVVDIDRGPWQAAENASRHDDPESVRRDSPMTTAYTVRVELNPTDAPVVISGAATTLIDAEPMSVAQRVVRSISSLLRFR